MCEVCHLRLNRRVSADGKTTIYMHGHGGFDHEPVPIMEPPEEDVILVCDFCLERHPVWNFGCRNFVDENSVTLDPTLDIGVALGDWASCTRCKELIVAEEWGKLADRSVQGQIAHNPEAAAAYAASPAIMFMNRIGMMELHQQFKQARTGPPQPIPQATWIASRLTNMFGEDDEAVPHHLHPTQPEDHG